MADISKIMGVDIGNVGKYQRILKSNISKIGGGLIPPGGFLYVSTTEGELTQTAPSASGEQVQIVGIATHADRIYFAPNYSIVEIA